MEKNKIVYLTHLGKKSGNLSSVPFDPMHAENDTTGRAFNQISPIFSNRFLRSTGSFFLLDLFLFTASRGLKKKRD